MRRTIFKAALVSASLVSSLVVGYSQAAWAGTLHNGWNYSIDSFNDGTQAGRVGKTSAYEFYGMAMKKTEDKVYFAINSNLSINGEASRGATNGTIAFGDMFLNFGDSSSVSAENEKQNLYAIRFTEANDTRKSDGSQLELGLYSKAKGVGLMGQNNGYTNLQWHKNVVNNNYNGSASFGDMDADTAYFNHDGGTDTTLNNTAHGYTNIEKGTFLGGIDVFDDEEGENEALNALGLDFGHFGATGSKTIGFSVDRELLPNASFIAHLFAECNNDGIVLAGDLADVPEPSTALSLAFLGLMGAGYRRLKDRKGEDS